MQKFAADGTFLATYDAAGALTTLRPEGLAFGPSGDLYIANNDSRVMRVREPGAPPPPPSQTGLPAPILGETVNVAPVSGQVFVNVPAGGAFASLSVPGLKGRRFVPLTSARQLPVGSYLDTRKGSVSLTSAAAKKGVLFTGIFSAGVFQALQFRSGLTDLPLEGRKLPPVRATEGQPSLRGPEPARDPAHARQLQWALPHPRALQRRHRARHDLGHHRPLRRHADPC